MELCLSIEIQEGFDYAATLATVQVAEAAGFTAALLAEHYYPSSGNEALSSADAWVFLGALARDTTKIRLGTLVSPVTFRHPSVLAKMAATLDQISNGRAELGLGAGWLEAEHAAYGFPFPSGPERVDILEEQLQVITGLWTQDRFTHHGARYDLDACRFSPPAVQQPHPPILVGGGLTATRLPRLAARFASEYVVGPATVEQSRTVRDRLDQACRQIGRDPSELSLALFAGLCVGATDAEVQQRREELLVGARPHMRASEAWLSGTPERAIEQLRRLSAAGVQRMMLSVDRDLHREMLPLLGNDVIPFLA